MRPCDCRSKHDELKLEEAGIGINENKFWLDHGQVYMSLNHENIVVKIPRSFMKHISEWYIEEQNDKLSDSQEYREYLETFSTDYYPTD